MDGVGQDVICIGSHIERGVTVAAIGNVLDPVATRRVRIMEPGRTVRDCVMEFWPLLPSGHQLIIAIDGRVCTEPALQALSLVLGPGQSLVFALRPGKGGDKNPLAIVASIALMVAAPYMVPTAWAEVMGAAAFNTGMFSSVGSAIAFSASAIAGGISLVGGALINAALPGGGVGADFGAGGSDISASATYSWDAKPNPIIEGGPVPVLYGTHRITPPLIGRYVELGEDGKQYLNLLYLIADHQVDGIGGCEINGTPASDFDGVTETYRLGTLNQEVIPSFSDTISEKSAGYVLGTDWSTIRTDGNAVQGLGVSLVCPVLYYANSGGELDETSVTVEMEYRKVGDVAWSALATVTITAKSTSAVRRFSRVDNIADGQYDVRARRTTAQSTDARRKDSVTFEGIQEIVYDDFRYPGTALAALRIQATEQLSGGLPTVTYLATRSTVPVWTGSAYEDRPASNPDGACYDILHNADYGGSVAASRILLEDFEAWADWCTEQNYQANVYFDSAMTLSKGLGIVSTLGRGSVVQAGNTFTCIVDKPVVTPVQRFLFTVGNILKDSFQQEWLSQEQRANAIEVTYFDAAAGYSRQVVTVYADDFDSTTVEVNKTAVTLVGCTSREQAIRHARYLLNCNRYLTLTISFGASVDALACLPGDVIDVSHDVPQWGYSGRVRAASANVTVEGDTTATVTLDRPVTLLPGQTYALTLKLSDDARLDLDVQGVEETTETSVLTILGGWPEGQQPARDDLYAFGPTNRVTKAFRIVSITKDGDMRRRVTALEYVPEVYDDTAAIPEPENPSSLAFVTGLGATEDWLVLDGVAYARVGLSWRGTALIWSVSMRVAGSEQWISLGTTINPFYEASGLVAGTDYEFRVSARGDSEMVALSYVGRPTAPEPVSSLSATVSAQGITATWQRDPAPWISGYDIELDGTVLEQGYAGNSYTIPPCAAVEHTVRVRARDLFGQVGEWASTSATPLAPAAPSVTLAIEGGQIRVSWAHNTRSFALANSEILHGDTLAGATSLGSSLTNTSIQFPGAAGSHKFWVRDTDVAGNTGPAGMAELVISAPGQVAISPQVIDNNVLLAWTEAAGTLPVADCELRRGATYAVSTPIGRIAGRFSTVFETVSGTYTYWITQRDVAGNDGTPSPITVQVSQPPDYVLQSDMASAFGGTKTNALLDGGALLMPVDTVSTVSARMTAGGWASRQAKASAGYPYRLEPTPAGASYVEVIDYGAILAGTKITVTQTSQLIHGSVALSCNLKVRASTSDAWTDLGNVWSAYGTNFRYVQVTITATPDGGSNDLLQLVELRIRLDVKLKNDAGSATCNSVDSGGTQVNFNVSFVDIQSITLTPAAGGSARYALYDFTDVPNPTGFKILLYDASGNRVSGTCSWSAKGV